MWLSFTILVVAPAGGDEPDITGTPAPGTTEPGSQEDCSSEPGLEQPTPTVGGNLNLCMF